MSRVTLTQNTHIQHVVCPVEPLLRVYYTSKKEVVLRATADYRLTSQ